MKDSENLRMNQCLGMINGKRCLEKVPHPRYFCSFCDKKRTSGHGRKAKARIRDERGKKSIYEF